MPVARAQGKLAIAMDSEQRRQEGDDDRERAGGGDDALTVPAADAIRRKRVNEATQLGGKLLQALAGEPARLFDTADGALTMMLWGVEKSTQRLQAALSRGSAAAAAVAAASAAANNGGGGSASASASAASAAAKPRPMTAHAESTSQSAALPTVQPRAPARSAELSARLLHWGDDGTTDPNAPYTPATDRVVAASKRQPLTQVL